MPQSRVVVVISVQSAVGAEHAAVSLALPLVSLVCAGVRLCATECAQTAYTARGRASLQLQPVEPVAVVAPRHAGGARAPMRLYLDNLGGAGPAVVLIVDGPVLVGALRVPLGRHGPRQHCTKREPEANNERGRLVLLAPGMHAHVRIMVLLRVLLRAMPA